MTYSENKLMWRKLKFTLIMLVVIIGCVAGRHFLFPIVNEGIKKTEEVTTLDNKISSTMKELENLNYTIEHSGKEFLDLAASKDDYVRSLGILCEANRLNIHKMTIDNIKSEGGGLSSMSVVLELQGELSEIRDFVNDVYSSEMLCRINSVSYRLENSAFSWMNREIDKNDTVEWWDISSVDGYLLTDPDAEPLDEEEVLDSSAFMKHGSALCYLEVQFIGLEG